MTSIFVAVIGAGGVGKAFLKQFEQLSDRLSKHAKPVQLSLVLLSRSSKLLFSESFQPLDLSSWEADLEASKTPVLNPSQIADYLSTAPGKAIVVDNTSNQTVADSYPLFLSRGISIVTPNKKAFSSGLSLWEDIFSSASNGTGSGGYVYHESSCGAGLPIISTVKDLVETGDEITKIEGVFSGTMSFLFNSFMPVGGGGGSFSAEVKKAKELGYTEPDPRDDLNGQDVARKLTILGRLAGVNVEGPTSFSVQSLIPKELESAQSGDEFLQRLPEFDDEMTKLKDEAAKQKKVLRFVGSVDVAKKELKVGLEQFDLSHPIAGLSGSDNIFVFHTKRYNANGNPLVIQGAGAGGDLTAMGVTADLIKVVNLLR